MKIREEQPPKTVFFVNARGVFQGGGCRAVAHAGAYQAATRCGVRFSEVAGTSAGAIVAALIGAGADSDFVLRKLSDMDFRKFMAPPESGAVPEAPSNWLLKVLPLRLIARFYSPAKVAYYGGCYSSLEIELWVDDLLSELLPSVSRPVKFRDLVISTKIVTTDLGAAAAKIWGSEETPNESVALAVRASCSIPGFFQPVVIGASRHVDGGLLSNLPAFVFAAPAASPSLGGRILAFSLVDAFDPPRSWSLENSAKRLINTVVDGAVGVQMMTVGSANVVHIDTAGILATDFDKIDPPTIKRLVDNGWRKTVDFISNEGVLINGFQGYSQQAADKDAFYESFVQESIEPGLELIVSEIGTHWFWLLFPTILAWRSSGAVVRVFTTPESEQGNEGLKERQRRGVIHGFGIELVVQPQLTWRGMMVRRQDESKNCAFVIGQNVNIGAPYGATYIGRTHGEILRMLYEKTGAMANGSNRDVVKVRSADPSLIVAKLKNGVHQYSSPNVSIALEDVTVSEVMMLNRRVRTYKFRQIEYLARLYKESGVPLFGPAEIFRGENRSISEITPPVIEVWGERRVVIEGNTRFFYSYISGAQTIKALVVRGVSQQLPGKPVEPRRVLFSSKEIPREVRIDGFNYDLFRNIERAARPLEG
jgi:predicted acylesterase/phospholipase RssA